MKKTKLSLAIAGLVLAGAIIATSCKKSTTTTTPDTSTTSSTDNNTAQQYAHDITNMGSEGIENNNGSLSTYRQSGGSIFGPLSAGVNVNIDQANKHMTVTFTTYTCSDGHVRNGTLYYDWSTSTNNAVWYRDSGLILNVTTPLNDYTVDGNNIKINSKVIKNIGRINGQLTWTDHSDITVTKANNGGTILWHADWSIALLNTSSYIGTTYNGTASTYTYSGVFNGYGGTVANSIDWTHALVSISSNNFGGTASDGETYSGNITTPLVLNFNCTPMWTKYLYVSGVLNFTPTGKATRTINYGTGACDLTYVVSIGSFSVTITI
ncbi:MAG TPA: hypothetical protein VKG26_03255 [Bacteroidia bacterium]|nr:hypothetical protein [Bacteroidia bacterium]